VLLDNPFSRIIYNIRQRLDFVKGKEQKELCLILITKIMKKLLSFFIDKSFQFSSKNSSLVSSVSGVREAIIYLKNPDWRKGRDSNPGYPFGYTCSLRPAFSGARPRLAPLKVGRGGQAK